jgi:hypothetical protein
MSETENFTVISDNSKEPIIEKKSNPEQGKDLFSEFARPTQKDDKFSKMFEPATPLTNQTATSTAPTGTGQITGALRLSAHKGKIKLWDFIFSLICSVIADESSEMFKAADKDLQELAEMMIQYEQSTGKMIPISPAFDLFACFAVIYGQQTYKVIQVVKQKKKARKTSPIEEKRPVYRDEEREFEKSEPILKTETRGGARKGAGRKADAKK